jgi:hypothetical protein
MPRRWIQSADVEISDAGALAVSSPAPTALSGGTRTVANTSAAALVTVSTPCRAVWIGPRMSAAGVALNSRPVLVGDAQNQNIPVMPSNFEGLTIAIDNAAKLFIKCGVGGEGVVYRIIA